MQQTHSNANNLLANNARCSTTRDDRACTRKQGQQMSAHNERVYMKTHTYSSNRFDPALSALHCCCSGTAGADCTLLYTHYSGVPAAPREQQGLPLITLLLLLMLPQIKSVYGSCSIQQTAKQDRPWQHHSMAMRQYYTLEWVCCRSRCELRVGGRVQVEGETAQYWQQQHTEAATDV